MNNATSRDPKRVLLRSALGANAVFSFACGLVFLDMSRTVSQAVAVPAVWVEAMGVALFGFAALVGWAASRSRPDGRLVVSISLADFGWVLGTAAGTLAHPMPTHGVWGAWIVASVVATFGFLQLLGLLRAHQMPRGAERPAYHCVTVRVAADPDVLWSRVADLGSISEYAPNLRSSVAGDGVRTCENASGQRWSEQLVARDDAARSLVLRFLTEAPDFPLPVTELIGGWRIVADGDGAIVTVWWEMTPKGGTLGLLAVAATTGALDADMNRTIRAMAGDTVTGSAKTTLLPC